MSGDWIKMRADLFTHPKIVRMASALKADTLRTVGGLMSAWCLFDAHSTDGQLAGYTRDALDDHLRWPGFSAAMIAVEWLLEVDGVGLELPRFSVHNGQSAKRRAQDADRKKDIRKASASEADKMRTREEKRREEKKEQKPPVVPHPGDGICPAVLDAYHATLPRCQRCETLTPTRRKRIQHADKLARQLCEQQGWTYDAAEFWGSYFGECAQDPWLRGDVPNPKNPRWRQNLDVLLAEDRFAGIMDAAISAMRVAA